jgi:hypothetical protein
MKRFLKLLYLLPYFFIYNPIWFACAFWGLCRPLFVAALDLTYPPDKDVSGKRQVPIIFPCRRTGLEPEVF